MAIYKTFLWAGALIVLAAASHTEGVGVVGTSDVLRMDGSNAREFTMESHANVSAERRVEEDESPTDSESEEEEYSEDAEESPTPKSVEVSESSTNGDATTSIGNDREPLFIRRKKPMIETNNLTSGSPVRLDYGFESSIVAGSLLVGVWQLL